MVENSEIAGIIIATIFTVLLIGLFILIRIRYPKRKDFKLDPLEEALIYITYGRSKHAIDILEKALKKNPDRNDIAEKLNELKALDNHG
jgi:hypothetical protein